MSRKKSKLKSEFAVGVYNRLISLKYKNESRERFVRKIGTSSQVLLRWKAGEVEPNPLLLEAIARRAGCTIEWLMTGEGPKFVGSDEKGPDRQTTGTGPPFNNNQKDIQTKEKGLTNSDITDNIQAPPVEQGDNFSSALLGAHRRIPLLNFISAGAFMEASDLDYPAGFADETAATDRRCGPRAFALRVLGDSMEPVFHAGDILIIDPDLEPRNGDYVIAKLAGSNEATFKKLVRNGDIIMLRPLNAKYADIVISDPAEVSAVYKVVERKTIF